MRKRILAAGTVALIIAACRTRPDVGTARSLAGAMGDPACPELTTGAAKTTFEPDPRENADIRTFVGAVGDLAFVASRVEVNVFGACELMATGLGIDEEDRTPQEGESRTSASCGAVAVRIEAIRKLEGAGQLRVDYVPPKCAQNAAADTTCRNRCFAVGADGRCATSCKADAALTAQCIDPQVHVKSTVRTGEIGKVAATLERNLAPLLKAQIAYGERIAGDVDGLVRIGRELPSAYEQLSAKSSACIGAAARTAFAAQASLRSSVQAAASVTVQAGAHAHAD